MIEKRQAEALAALACAIRPSWGHQGVLAAIAKVRHLGLDEVTQAVTRAALDPELRTPGAIGNTTSSCWQPVAAPMVRPTPVRGAGCYTCGKSRTDCERNPHSGHNYETTEQAESGAVECPPEVDAQLRELLARHKPEPEPSTTEDPDPMLELWESPS